MRDSSLVSMGSKSGEILMKNYDLLTEEEKKAERQNADCNITREIGFPYLKFADLKDEKMIYCKKIDGLSRILCVYEGDKVDDRPDHLFIVEAWREKAHRLYLSQCGFNDRKLTPLRAVCTKYYAASINNIFAVIFERIGNRKVSLRKQKMSDDDQDSPLSGISSLVRLSGVNVPARAQFIGETLVSATLTSVTTGFCSGLVGAVLFPTATGPLVPALIGFGAGYNFGLFTMWAGAKRRMMWYAQQYPTLLAHALRTENQIIVPLSVIQASQDRARLLESVVDEDGATCEVHGAGGYNSHLVSNREGPTTLDQWIMKGGLGRVTWSLLAAQSCRRDVGAVQQQQRQKIVDGLAQEFEGNGIE